MVDVLVGLLEIVVGIGGPVWIFARATRGGEGGLPS